MIITIDGPVATGKSTIAKTLARELGFIHFDTGAMYRCLTREIMARGISLDDSSVIEAFLDQFQFDIKLINGDQHYFVGNEDITDVIRSPGVTKRVSEVSALREVREKLVDIQRSLAHGVDAVFEGRDMGTVVFPQAEVKVFLTGRPEVRAKRRLDELRIKFPEDATHFTIDQMLKDIEERDAYDTNRSISPLQKAEDAYVIDTSELTVQEIIQKIKSLLV